MLFSLCKNSDYVIHSSWLKDSSRNGQYLDFLRSLLSNVYYFFCVVLNWSFSSRTYLFSPMERRSPKSNESRKVTAVSNKISEPDEKKTLEITHQMLLKCVYCLLSYLIQIQLAKTLCLAQFTFKAHCSRLFSPAVSEWFPRHYNSLFLRKS